MRRGVAVAAACLLWGGCSVGPKYRRPTVVTTPAYKENLATGQWKTASPSDSVLRGTWWELFGDAQLNGLEQAVAVSNQNVKQAEAQFRQARALVVFNRAGYFPTVTTQPSISTSLASSNLGSHRLGGAGAFTLYDVPFSVSWEPNLWGRVSLAVENAVAGAQSSAADLANMRLSMQANLAADYFQLRGLDMDQQLLTDTVADYEKALQLTVERHNNGVASRADVVQAQAQLDGARAQLTDLGVARAQFEHAIAVLTGQPPATLSMAQGRIPGPPPPIPAGVPSELLERRPDIASAERQVAAANAQVGLTRVAYFPTVSLNAGGGFESDVITTLLSWPSHFWSVGPSVAETLLDFGRRHAQVQQAWAAYDATVAAYRQTVLSAFQDVEDNLAALRLLEREATQQQAAVEAARESLRLELDQYKSGTVSYLDVITTQTILLGDQRASVGILERRMVAAVQLIAALGGGWNANSLPTPAELHKK